MVSALHQGHQRAERALSLNLALIRLITLLVKGGGYHYGSNPKAYFNNDNVSLNEFFHF